MLAKVTVKEKSGHILHPSYESKESFNRDFIIDFFGLEEDDVESYEIEIFE